MSTYTTIQGDTWDLIAYKLYGSERHMKALIEANWPLLEVLVFSSGTVINVPEISEEDDEDAPFWRRPDASDELDDYVEEVEEDG